MADEVEITVKDAATRLGLSERQVRNYIKSRSIHAIKVGREWFVDLASVAAFQNRYHPISNNDHAEEQRSRGAEEQRSRGGFQNSKTLSTYSTLKLLQFGM